MARPILIPNTGMYTVEGKLIEWRRPSGAPIALGEVIADVETDKSVFEIESPAAGVLHHTVAVGTTVSLETVIAYILAPGEAPPDGVTSAAVAGSAPKPDPRARKPQPGSAGDAPSLLRASPIARRLASEHGIDLASLVGSGPGGRIVEADVLAAVKQPTAGAVASGAEWTVRQRIPLTGIRGATAARLRQSLAATVPVTLTHEFRTDLLVSERRRLAPGCGGDLPYDALFIKALAIALRDFPELNATVVDDHILVLDEINVGFAAAVPRGLVVPVIRNAGSESLARVAALVREFHERARAGTLTQRELSGGTVTITNLGASEIDAFTPVLNPPQSIILGIGRIVQRAVVDGNQVVPGSTCVLSLTFDHRITDGLPAARLLQRVAGLLNDRGFFSGLMEIDKSGDKLAKD